jgi:DNA invertase Pin-like site-specific DNA recombinase
MSDTRALPRAFSDVFKIDEPIHVYSYIRFSTKAQSLGFSEQRQLEQINQFFEQYPAANQVERFEDLGVSAFKGKNLKTGKLADFLNRLKANEIKDNALLLVESFDRISRMGGYDALEIIISIIQSDCAIYTLFDNRLYSKRKKDSSADISLIQNILERASDESRSKSERSKDAKTRNLKRAENGEIINKRGPFWLTYTDGKFEFNEHARAVKRATELIFDVGCLATATELNKENHSKKYSVGIISKILRQKALYGSYVAYGLDDKGKRTIIKQEIKNYYPALISESEFNLIGAKLEERHTPALAGRHPRDFNNILRGISYCKCGSTLRSHSSDGIKKQYHYLICTASETKNCPITPGRIGRYSYQLVSSIFLDYQHSIQMQEMISTSKLTEKAEKELKDVQGELIGKEQALKNAMAVLDKASSAAYEKLISHINTISFEIDALNTKKTTLEREVMESKLTIKSNVLNHELIRLLITPSGRIKINNFLKSKKVKIICEQLNESYFNISIYLGDDLIDTIKTSKIGNFVESLNGPLLR